MVNIYRHKEGFRANYFLTSIKKVCSAQSVFLIIFKQFFLKLNSLFLPNKLQLFLPKDVKIPWLIKKCTSNCEVRSKIFELYQEITAV
jgi:hypothetical protein